MDQAPPVSLSQLEQLIARLEAVVVRAETGDTSLMPGGEIGVRELVALLKP